MIPVAPVPEPPEWISYHQAGLVILATSSSNERPTDLWSEFKPVLRKGFGGRCGYTAMYEPVGTVDHYLSCKNHRAKAYDWDNYRYVSAWINSSKKTIDDKVLDPYEVQDGWFEIHLPSLQLCLTSAIPAHMRAKAKFTLKRLHLKDDERVIGQRQELLDMYESKELTLAGLQRMAPLLAAAIQKRDSASTV